MTWTITAPAEGPRSDFLRKLRFDRLDMPKEVQALMYCVFMSCRPNSVTVVREGATLVATADPPLTERQRIQASNGARGYVPSGIDWRID